MITILTKKDLKAECQDKHIMDVSLNDIVPYKSEVEFLSDIVVFLSNGCNHKILKNKLGKIGLLQSQLLTNSINRLKNNQQ